MVTIDEPACVSLGQLRVGAYARLHAAQLEPDDADALRAMGLRPDVRLRVCKRGEPCIVCVNPAGCRIAMSRGLADRVLVRPE